MKLASRKILNVGEQRRHNLQFERQKAVALREMYPSIGHLQILLVFGDGSANPPSPQSHTYFPAARAFFRFACPCAECDGDFDLGHAVASLLADPPRSQRRAASAVRGRLSCEGVRLRDRVGSRSCAMTLEYQLVVGPVGAA